MARIDSEAIFPNGFATDAGHAVQVSIDQTFGDSEQTLLSAIGRTTYSPWPGSGVHLSGTAFTQAHLNDVHLQTAWQLAGSTAGALPFPRGYDDLFALGRYAHGLSIALRAPLYRPFLTVMAPTPVCVRSSLNCFMMPHASHHIQATLAAFIARQDSVCRLIFYGGGT